MDDLTAEFIAETRETLENIGEALVAWEANPADTARLDEIFRFVHTVKGSCGFLDLARIEALAHGAETVLGELRNGRAVGTTRLVSAILRVIDRIKLLVDALDLDAEFPPVEIDHAILAALDGAEHADPGEEPHVPQQPSRVRSVRVAVDLLDALMSQVSDLVLVRNELGRSIRTPRGDSAAEASLDRLSTCLADLRDNVARARMQPVERLFSALPRLVRDTAAALGKDVELIIDGSDVELDREMVEQLRDPLVHMVRNAIDHGIEPKQVRLGAGKPARATLKVEARQNGNQIAISVADDGQGLDCARLRSRAIDEGRIDSRTAAAMSDEAAAELVFMPGLSTAQTVSAISGRGVGMDVVRANIEKLGGMIALDNRPGSGLTVELRAPLTLSIVTVLPLAAGSQTVAVPRTAVSEVFSLRSQSIVVERLGEGRIVKIRGETLPVMALATLSGDASKDEAYLVILDSGNGHRWALAVGAVGDHQEVVIRPVAPVIAASGLFAGQALPDDGKPLLILDVLGLARLARIEGATNRDDAVSLKPAAPQMSLITCRARSGSACAVPAASVERLVDMPATAFTRIGDALIVHDDGLIYSAVLDGALDDATTVPMLRLARGSDRLGLIVAEAQDLIRVDRDAIARSAAGDVIVIDGRAVPIIDTDALFDTDSAAPGTATPAPATPLTARTAA